MKNRIIQGLIVILVVEVLLLAFSWFRHQCDYDALKSEISFIDPEQMFVFSKNNKNKGADSLLMAYMSNVNTGDAVLKRTPLSNIGPRKQNLFLTNPVTDSVSALDHFFEALLHEQDTAVIRIAHYGDSQLEGDRMSWVIRDKFHEKFGGSGIGYVPLKDLAPVSYTRNSSGNWSKYTVFHDRYNSSFYGLSGCVFRFSKYTVNQTVSDSLSDDIPADTQQVVKGQAYYNAYVSMKIPYKYSFSKISVLYGNAPDPCLINITSNDGNTVLSQTMKSTKSVRFSGFYPESSVLSFKIEFSSDISPDFYGLYLDGSSGVQVDNYSIRGHSGDGLMLINDEHLVEMIRLTNTRLIIFQYGANVVPCIHSEKACESIGALYYNLFMKFRKAMPDISILVIGAGDMARGGEGGYSSYKWLPMINEMQKQAALKAGCAYWDLFNMMGGSNSILVWADKKMAVTNGHFSAKGQEVVANEIVEALMIEYNMYQHRKRTKQ